MWRSSHQPPSLIVQGCASISFCRSHFCDCIARHTHPNASAGTLAAVGRCRRVTGIYGEMAKSAGTTVDDAHVTKERAVFRLVFSGRAPRVPEELCGNGAHTPCARRGDTLTTAGSALLQRATETDALRRTGTRFSDRSCTRCQMVSNGSTRSRPWPGSPATASGGCATS